MMSLLFATYVVILVMITQIVKMMPATSCLSNAKSVKNYIMVVVLKSAKILPLYPLNSKRNCGKIQKELYLEHFLILESNQGWTLSIESTNIVFIQEMPIRDESKNGTCL